MKRDPFWQGYKSIIRRYGSADGTKAHDLRPHERIAVFCAVDVTRALPDGQERLRLIDAVFWRQSHTLEGAALLLHISERTARRWHTDFIREVGRQLWGEPADGIFKERRNDDG